MAGVTGMGITARTGRGVFERESVIGPDAEVKIAAAGDKRGRGVDRHRWHGVIRVTDRSNANDW